MNNKEFVDKDHAKVYSVYRRDIPQNLIEIIINYVKEKIPAAELQTAVDVGCGAGQSTIILTPFFNKVVGLDVSEAQITEAQNSRKSDKVQYMVQVAEKIDLPDESVQLITASSCLHWFELDVFFPEARRVLSNNGVLATYLYTCVKPIIKDDESRMKQIDDVINEFYTVRMKPYWSPKAAIAFDLYKNLDFPFEEIDRRYNIYDIFEGTLQDLIGYVKTLSGYQKLKKEAGEDAASEVLYDFINRLCDIIQVKDRSQPEAVPLTLCRDFTLVLCRKKN